MTILEDISEQIFGAISEEIIEGIPEGFFGEIPLVFIGETSHGIIGGFFAGILFRVPTENSGDISERILWCVSERKFEKYFNPWYNSTRNLRKYSIKNACRI